MSKPLRVLLVEDSDDDALQMLRALSTGGYEPLSERVETAAAVTEALHRQSWDVILADYTLPEFSALATLELLKREGLDLPFIVLSGTVGEEAAVQAMRAGAHDYIMKDNLRRLVPAVDRELREAAERKERRRAVGELIRERQFSNAIINTSGALIVVLDPEGCVIRFNGACQKTTGYSLDEVKDRPIFTFLIPPQEGDVVKQVFAALTSGTSCVNREHHWLAKNGDSRLISWAYTRVLDAETNVRWVLATGIDVTEKRQLEEQLLQAAKLQAVGQLAGGIAHDFNNLLTAIIGYVDLNLPLIPKGTKLREDLELVRGAAKRAADLTRQLLTFSRQEVVEPDVVDLNPVVQDVCKMLRHLIEENVEMRVLLCEEPLKVKADPAQLGQVLMNLAVNARDAMPRGGLLTIETSVARPDKDDVSTWLGLSAGRYARLRVTDTGVGMTEEVRERIFDPFFTTKPAGRGTGLGLSTVYGIVNQHGGRIECSSEPDMGSTFRIFLPLVETEEALPPEGSSIDLRFGGNETILLVEDEEDVRNLAARALQDFGYNVLCAANGPEALELLQRHNRALDLLITDLIMPRMDGRELAQKVRLRRPDAKLLFMSGYAGDSAARLRADVPGFTVLQKPFTAHKLAKRVREVLDGS